MNIDHTKSEIHVSICHTTYIVTWSLGSYTMCCDVCIHIRAFCMAIHLGLKMFASLVNRLIHDTYQREIINGYQMNNDVLGTMLHQSVRSHIMKPQCAPILSSPHNRNVQIDAKLASRYHSHVDPTISLSGLSFIDISFCSLTSGNSGEDVFTYVHVVARNRCTCINMHQSDNISDIHKGLNCHLLRQVLFAPMIC